MRLTTKGRFAVTAMLDLAMQGGKSPVTLAGISQRQSISLSYLEQLFGKLRRHTLVDSTRGPGGATRSRAVSKGYRSRTSSPRWTSRSMRRSAAARKTATTSSEEHTSELQSHLNLVCRL